MPTLKRTRASAWGAAKVSMAASAKVAIPSFCNIIHSFAKLDAIRS